VLLLLRTRFGIGWEQARRMPQQELALLIEGLLEAVDEQATDGRPERPTIPKGGDDAEVPPQLAALP